MKSFFIVLAIALAVAIGIYIIRRSPVMMDQTASPIPTNVAKNNYTNKTLGISVNIPEGYTTDEKYEYQKAPKETIPGVKFTIPASMAQGTNLSTDSYVSVEKMNGASCSADSFLDGSHNAAVQTINGTNYSVASSDGAGAGNRYEETVYALQGSTCVAVRYFIHYGAIQNYPEGKVREFDKDAILHSFDQIRDTLVVI